MKRPKKRSLIGKWRVIEMALWDKDYLDMVEPAYIQFNASGIHFARNPAERFAAPFSYAARIFAH